MNTLILKRGGSLCRASNTRVVSHHCVIERSSRLAITLSACRLFQKAGHPALLSTVYVKLLPVISLPRASIGDYVIWKPNAMLQMRLHGCLIKSHRKPLMSITNLLTQGLFRRRSPETSVVPACRVFPLSPVQALTRIVLMLIPIIIICNHTHKTFRLGIALCLTSVISLPFPTILLSVTLRLSVILLLF